METIFRNLLLVCIALSFTGWLLPFIDYLWLNQDQINFLNQSGFDSFIPYNIYFYWFTFLLWAAIYLSLYLYVKPAKRVFFIVLAFSYILSYFYGTQVVTALENIVFGILTLSQGAIIAILLFTSIGERFERNS